ncbi:MAG TPA: HTH-type transcriptional repressor FabR [Kofleriaceae bacterium]|jgi:AcrR family transcriptional regulator|nr:HTH-type transcriptional repressor FabR [Kofleriaceae bacterium]
MKTSRDEQKLRTRQALLDGALRLIEQDHTFSSLSLREVTREAGVVPTAFYRHFEDMGEMGLALVDEAFRTLRELMRAARSGPVMTQDVIRRSVNAYVDHVLLNRSLFLFVARELTGGRKKMRAAVAAELRLFVTELTTDLARIPPLSAWTTDDLQMIAGLIVGVMIQAAHAIVELPPDRPDDERALRRATEKQLRLIFLGARLWRST